MKKLVFTLIFVLWSSLGFAQVTKFEDTFTGSTLDFVDGSYSADTGAATPWTEIIDTDGGISAERDSGHGSPDSSRSNDGLFFQANGTEAPTDDIVITAVFTDLQAKANEPVWFVWRYTDTSNFYALKCGNVYQVIEYTGGTESNVGSSYGTVGATDTVIITVSGANITVNIGGTDRITTSDASHTSGEYGIGWGKITGDTNHDVATDNEINSYKVEHVAGGGGSNDVPNQIY